MQLLKEKATALLFPQQNTPVRSKTILEYSRTYHEAMNVPEWDRPEWVNAMHLALTHGDRAMLIGYLPIIRLCVYDYLVEQLKTSNSDTI